MERTRNSSHGRRRASADKQSARTGDEEQRAALWGGAIFVAVALVGLFLFPTLKLIWIVMFVFGIATVPQVLVWRYRAHSDRRRR